MSMNEEMIEAKEYYHNIPSDLSDNEENARTNEDHHRRMEKSVIEKEKKDLEIKYCCKNCLRENRHNGRSCICLVPSSQRRTPISI